MSALSYFLQRKVDILFCWGGGGQETERKIGNIFKKEREKERQITNNLNWSRSEAQGHRNEREFILKCRK